MTTRHAACSCGQLHLTIEGESARISMCHCLACQRRTGAVFGNQARRVSQICKSIGEILKLSEEERRVLDSAALLHDIGLVGVPRQIIRRWQDEPESLSAAEKALIEQHPILGQELAGFTSDLVKVGEVIRAHHERFDGTGYPDQLVGENIPWLARLLAVAVTYASSPLSHEDAIDIPHEGEAERLTAEEPVGVRHVLVNGTPIRVDGAQIESLDPLPGTRPEIA